MRSKSPLKRMSIQRTGSGDVTLRPYLWALLVACFLCVLLAVSRDVVEASDEIDPGSPTVTNVMFSPTPAATDNATRAWLRSQGPGLFT